MPTYKSYCWSLGTTSFRMVEFNRKIEEQLKLLNQFWQIPEYADENWSSNNNIQTAYYNFIREQGFIEEKDAPRKDKDARQKTSGLVDLGIIDDERRLTDAGRALLAVAESGNFSRDNILRISADSFIYFKQLLKLSCQFDEEIVRPYVILAYMISELGEISKEEFTYLLPLAINQEKTKEIIGYIRAIRRGKTTIDSVITEILSEMINYRVAKTMFLSSSHIDELIIQEIGMNRKSRSYDKPYTKLYKDLLLFKDYREDCVACELIKSVKQISGKAQTYWKQYLFNTPLTAKIEREGASTVNYIPLFEAPNEQSFREEFFKLLHLFKAKSLLDDYYDLNKRYFKTSDTIIFQDDKVRFDIIPNCYFALVKDSLLNLAFSKANNLESNCELSKLSDTVWDFIANDKLFSMISQYQKNLAGKNQGVLKLKLNIDSFKQSINECERIIREKRASVVCIDNAINEINSLLLGFGFKGFKIEKKDEISYRLVRADGSEVKETLSEGEHRFITFLYFYQLVNGTLNRENVNKDKILVIDDPISSLDSNILFIVSYLVRELIKNCLNDGNVKQRCLRYYRNTNKKEYRFPKFRQTEYRLNKTL